MTEHYCRRRASCSNAKHCLQQMDAQIDVEPGPRYWIPSRLPWVEQAMEWQIDWQANHAIMETAVQLSFKKGVAELSKSDKHPEADALLNCAFVDERKSARSDASSVGVQLEAHNVETLQKLQTVARTIFVL